MILDCNELLGQALGTCTLKRLLGRGGMGAVYLAQQSRPRRTVAVKVLLPGLLLEKRPRAEFLARFRREADAIAALDHVNIMPIYEYGEQEDIAYLVMPYVTGGTLREALEARKIPPIGETITIIEQAAAGLTCAHEQGIIHRDLKPANILFHADGRVLLADFGLAKVLREMKEHDDSRKRTALTSAGTIVGTPEYLSPEQGTGKPIDHRSDIYSLGVVLYQMLTGSVPFSGASPVAIAIKHAMETPPSIIQLNPEVPADIEAVVLKALAKKPEDRYGSAKEMAQALHEAASKHAIEPLAHASSKTVVEHLALISVEPPQAAPAPQQEEENPVQGDDAPTEPPISVFETDIHAHSPEVLEAEALAMHNAATDATPLLPAKAAALPVAAAALSAVATLADIAPVPQPPPLKLPAQEQVLQEATVQRDYSPAHIQRNGWQSLSMMLLGSLLTLVLVVAAVASYLYIAPRANTSINKSVRPQAHLAATVTTQKPALPAALIPVGQLLYGTALPGTSCDPQHGRWSSTTNAKVTCGSGAVTLSNAGGGHLAGMFLDRLPNNRPFPQDYVLQVQATAQAGSQGAFGVFFRNQPGAQQGTYSFMLDPAGSWKANVYDNATGDVHTLVQLPQRGVSAGLMTIDIVVRGNTYTFYINGVQQGYAVSGQYLSGTVGLGADIGASVSFENLALYTLS